MHFGEHLMIDGYGGDFELLNSEAVVKRALDELPLVMGMNKLAPPVVYSAPDNGKKDPGGWSGIVVIAESHISVHTFPARGFVSIDVYTCQNGLDQERIKEYFKKAFKLNELEVNFVLRGKKYPLQNIQ